MKKSGATDPAGAGVFSNVKRMRQFYLTFPQGAAMSDDGTEKGSAVRSFSEGHKIR